VLTILKGYLTLSENTSWLALSDQIANGIEVATLVQVRNEALDQLGLLVVEMRELALRNLNGEDVTDQLADKELEISTLVGSNIIGLPKETVFMSSEANPSDLLTIDEIDYFGELSVADLLTGEEFRVASLEVDITQVSIAHFQASQAHDPDTCPICGGSFSLGDNEAAAAPTSAGSTAVGYTTSSASGTNYIDALNSTRTWDLASGESLSYSYYDGTVAFDSTAYTGREDLIANATSIASHASDLGS